MSWTAEHDYTMDSGDFSVMNRPAHQALLRLIKYPRELHEE